MCSASSRCSVSLVESTRIMDRNRHFLASSDSDMFGITQKLKLLQQQKVSLEVKEEEDGDNQPMNGTNNNGEEEKGAYEEYNGGDEEDNGVEQYDEEEYSQGFGYSQDGGEGEEEGGEEDYDYPDISEFVQTEFEGECEDDEEDRGLPPVDMRFIPQAGYPPDEEEEEEDTTASLIQSLPPGTFIQQTKRPNSSPSSTSARTSTTLNNLLLLRNNGTTPRKTVSAATALSNALMLMEQQQQLADEENEDQAEYYGSNGVPLSLIVQQQGGQGRKGQGGKRGFRGGQMSTSALLEQLQSPSYSKPNILSRKLMGGQGNGRDPFQNGSRPPPRLQPRPNSNSRVPQQPPPQQITLETLLRKAQSGSKQLPRLQTISPKSTPPQNYIVDGRKLSFKTAQFQKQKSPTRSLESLMLSHQKSTQLQQQLTSGRMRSDGIMVGNLHIRQVSQPVIRNNGNSLLRNSAAGAGVKNVPRCHVCRKTFATNQVLQRHLASVHGFAFGDVDVGKIGSVAAQLQGGKDGGGNSGGGNGAHRCRVCYRTFGSIESLRAHALNHEGEFKCRACRRGFPSWEILEQHEATHKKYECRWCEKYFMNSGNLKAHERIHTGERPYKCADCPKGFKQLGGLQYHLKTNPTHRPQKYKLEDQDNSQQSSPQDYSTSNSLLNADMYAEDGSEQEESFMDEETYLDMPTASM